MAEEPPGTLNLRQCARCRREKASSEFGLRTKTTANGGKAGELNARCLDCVRQETEARKARKQKKRAAEGEPVGDSETLDGDLESQNIDVISFTDFINLLRESDDPIKVAARVDISSAADISMDPKERANRVAAVIGEYTLLHWTFETKSARRRTDATVFSYSCAQLADREPKAKVPKGEKARDTRRMSRFDCNGWLHITVSAKSDVVDIQCKHMLEHLPYVNIDLPDKWKAYIRDNARTQTPGQIWRHIVREETEGLEATDINLPFRSKSVYYYWHVISREEWRLADDPIDSARTFLEREGESMHVAVLDVTPEPRTEVLAFEVTDFMNEWAQHTQELAMDSTWNTNRGNFELFAAVADAKGSGVPLAFLLIRTSKDAQSGAKQAVLERFLGQLKLRGVEPEFTLSDKDWSEINAMRATWPEAKHQLCFWHALRALKQRLAKKKDTPAPYDSEAAHREFNIIDPAFVPLGQRCDNGDLEIPLPPEKPVPRVRLLINGRPLVLTPSLPKIILTRAAIERALHIDVDRADTPDVQLPEESFDTQAATDEGALPPGPATIGLVSGDDCDDRSDEGNFWGDKLEAAAVEEEDEWDGIEDDLRRQVEEVAEDSTNIDTDAPSEPSETGPRSRRADYEFCPAAHRLPIMRLFAKHASQHPLLPERHGQARSSDQVRRDAVTEMYLHCKTNNLTEVWAYLWGAWYSSSRWKLWARSAYAASIPTKRTTMMVEALWRNLKRLVLHLYNRPPLDLAIYAIVTKSLPPYRHTLSQILGDARPGRARSLTHFQQAFKRSWERLRKVPIKGSYQTNVSAFTCDCGAQKYHSYLLCKHLVQASGDLPSSWWPNVLRYHIPPFYTIPVSGHIPLAPESTRNHAWLARMKKGKGKATGDSIASTTAPDERLPQAAKSNQPQEVIEINDSDSDLDVPIATSSPRGSSPPITSSPNKPPPTGKDGLLRTRAGGGAGFDLDDTEDVETDEAIRLLSHLTEVLEEQRDNPDFLRRAKRTMRTTLAFARDVEKHVNRRTMPKTNARGREGQAATNLIGYKHPT